MFKIHSSLYYIKKSKNLNPKRIGYKEEEIKDLIKQIKKNCDEKTKII